MTQRRWIAFVLLGKLALVCALAADSQSPATPPQPESPRLRALAAALDAHDADALTRFWKDVDAAGAPLIESVPGRPDDVLFTFLWKAEPHQVALNVQFNGWFPLHTNQGFDNLTRLQESGVWYTTYTLPQGARQSPHASYFGVATLSQAPETFGTAVARVTLALPANAALSSA